MRRLSPVLLAAVVLVAACTEQSSTEFDANGDIADVFRIPTTPPPLYSLDATFAQVAGAIPGFGGLYFDEQGKPNVYMRAVPGAPQLSASELAAALNAQLSARGLAADVSATQLVVREGMYDFGQLHAYHQGLVPVLSEPGVVFTDADETTNRLVIGVEPGTSEAAIRDAVAALGVPLDAVSVVETEPIRLLHEIREIPEAREANIGDLPTLRDEIRPIAGGLQIWRLVTPTSGSICTLGFNAAAPSFSQGRLMFTNSHCSAVRGQVTGTAWAQKAFALPHVTVAVEVEDPPFFTNAQNAACPVGRNCRYSDAAAGEYQVPNPDVSFPRVAMPFPGTLVLPDETRSFRIVEEASTRAMVGQGLMKVGRTSGLTGAAVIATCQNANVSGAGNITMLCQERVAIDAIGGDSGSPVLEAMDNRAFMDVTPNQRVRLHGLLWGGSANSYVFSSMINIRQDFGGPWVVTQ